ncbi:MAG: C-terminal binding protein [Verrucomicrobia bacterium]|nr:C-terminal binding protein [Verrucomicrobiota bacterium]
MKKVYITDFIAEPLEPERKVLAGVAEVIALEAGSEKELRGQIEDADALMIYHFLTLGRETIESLKQCKVIVRPGVGYDMVDVEAARERGIPVCNVPDYGTEEVADSAMAMALSLMRGVNLLNRRLQRGDGKWSVEQAAPLQRLRGRVFGVIGLGRIGTAAALRAKAHGMEVVFYDPYVPDGKDKALGMRRVDDLSELLKQAHVISLHCPLTDETRGMLGTAEINQMTAGSFLVNTARGGVVDTDAVVDALASRHLAGAGIDVLEKEPPDDNNAVLQAWRDVSHPAHDRLIINPHAAFYCEQGEEEFRRKGAEEVKRALLAEALRNVVN